MKPDTPFTSMQSSHALCGVTPCRAMLVYDVSQRSCAEDLARSALLRASTLVDVAKKAGVCTMTVSRVLNGVEGVRPRTIARVNEAVAALGYRQNEAARLMKGQRARLIGYVVPDLSDEFFAACAHQIQQLATANGYMTLVASSGRSEAVEAEQVSLMADRMPSGILIVTSRKSNDYLRPLQKAGLVLGGLNRPLAGLDADIVMSENRHGAALATEHLLGHGHTRILCIGQDGSSYGIQERYEGYREAMLGAGRSPEPLLEAPNLSAVTTWLAGSREQKRRPTAVLTLNHRCSKFFYAAAQELGVAIPEDYALFGFDDFELATLLRPSLSSVSQSVQDLTRRAMDLLIDRIRQKETAAQPAPVRLTVPIALRIRNSCGCAADS